MANVHEGLSKVDLKASQVATTLIKTLGGAAIGAFSGAILAGAGQMQNIMAQFAASTGESGAAVRQAGDAISHLYSDNIDGLTEIETVMANVHNVFQLTGDDATALSQDFLTFGVATGINAAGAVNSMHSALAAFNLDASATQDVMDRLTYSHQQFGINIDQELSVLSRLGPAFDAAGMSMSDAIGYLNMFQAAGINSTLAAAGLRIALTKVKSPEELQTLIEQIHNTTDAFQRSQLASQLFGARAGPQLAQALAQGNLSQYIVTQNQAAGATQQAADAIEGTWGNQFTLMMHKASDVVIEFGNNFGNYFDAIAVGAAQLGPKLSAALFGATGGLGGLFSGQIKNALMGTVPVAAEAGAAAGAAEGGAQGAAFAATAAESKVLWLSATEAEMVPAATAVGAEAGAAEGAAMAGASGGGGLLGALSAALLSPVGLAAVAALAVGISWSVMDDQLNKQAAATAQKATDWAKTATDAQLATASAEITKQKNQGLLTVPLNVVFGLDAKIDQSLNAIVAEQERRAMAAMTPEQIQQDIREVQAELDKAMAGTEKMVTTGMAGGQMRIVVDSSEVTALQKQLADLKAQLPDTVSAVDKATADAAAAASADAAAVGAAEYAAVEKQLAAEAAALPGVVAKGIQSSRDVMTNEWDALVKGLQNQRTPAAEEGDIIGALVSKNMAAGLASGDPVVQNEAKQLMLDGLARIKELVAEGTPLGAQGAQAIADGLKSKNPEIRAAAQQIQAQIDAQFASTQDVDLRKRQLTSAYIQPIIDMSTDPQLQGQVHTAMHTVAGWVQADADSIATWKLTVTPGYAGSSGGGPGSGGSAQNPRAFAAGTVSVPYDMAAIVHQGEMIIPADTAQGLRDVWASPAAGAGAGGGDVHIHSHIYLDGKQIAESVEVRQGIRYLLSGSSRARPTGA